LYGDCYMQLSLMLFSSLKGLVILASSGCTSMLNLDWAECGWGPKITESRVGRCVFIMKATTVHALNAGQYLGQLSLLPSVRWYNFVRFMSV